ncbi:MAG TPA: NADH-quinone oxidoreductase subunit M [bacterium]|nr:NADH-quinone oxidoreductase subunit M [bacterium]HPR87027.1 NADH-quinone oxidoreductase subunit M [bacterium]
MIDLSSVPILSLLTFLPLAGALLLLFVPRQYEQFIRRFTLTLTLVVFLLALPLFGGFDGANPGFQFEELRSWIPSAGIGYHLGIDGISLLMVMLTAFLTPLVILGSWSAVTKRVKEYMMMFLVLETAMLGVFLSLDLILFYIFWEGMLIPMYFIIGVWGGERRLYAAIKFFLFTMFGGVLMLVAILALCFLNGSQTGTYTFDYLALSRLLIAGKAQVWLFFAFSLAFAIKVPMFPLHTWLPDAHVEAPTGGSVILAGILLKMGTYGFLRFCIPLFPNATANYGGWIMALAVIGILYGALVSWVQPDLKKLVAFSSVSHLGFVMLGIFALTLPALQGGILQMVNHGLSTGALFLLVGMIYERRHTRLIADFGGLARQMPVFVTFFAIFTLSSIGLPGLNGFVGEFLVLVGTFQVQRMYAILAAAGVILSAVYMLTMFQRMNFGKLDKAENQVLKDLNRREIATLVPIVLLCLWIGLYPAPFLDKSQAAAQKLLTDARSKQDRIALIEAISTSPTAMDPVK